MKLIVEIKLKKEYWGNDAEKAARDFKDMYLSDIAGADAKLIDIKEDE